MKSYAWEEGNLLGNYLYYDKKTGEIIGEVSRIGMTGTRTSASSYIDRKLTVYLGNYIDSKYAKKAVEEHTDWCDRMVEGHFLES